MALTNSKRLLYSANHVTTELTEDDQESEADEPQGAFRKLGFVRALKIGEPQVTRLRELINRPANQRLERVLGVAANLKEMSHLQAASELARVPVEHLVAFAELTKATTPSENVSNLTILLEAFKKQQKVSPVGRLHLERLEMYPVGVEKGELVFTVPMAPGETVTVSHKEWSTTSEEYEQIVELDAAVTR